MANQSTLQNIEVLSNKPKLSPLETYLVARALIDPIKAYFDIPENEEKFQKWLKSQKGDAEVDKTE